MRFYWMYRYSDQGENKATGAHVVLDTEPENGEFGQVIVYGNFLTKEAAVLTCEALNLASSSVTT